MWEYLLRSKNSLKLFIFYYQNVFPYSYKKKTVTYIVNTLFFISLITGFTQADEGVSLIIILLTDKLAF